MEFKDRKPQYPGRVKLKNVSTGVEAVYDLSFAEGSVSESGGYEAGTPLNKATFDQFKQEILQAAVRAQYTPGPKGEKGDAGVTIDKKTFIVGGSQSGLYRVGRVSNTLTTWKYSGLLRFTNVTDCSKAPFGDVAIAIKCVSGGVNTCDARWVSSNGEKESNVYYMFSSSVLDVYVYLTAGQKCRVDVLGESNETNYTSLFVPSASYGGINTALYSSGTSIGTKVRREEFSSSVQIDKSTNSSPTEGPYSSLCSVNMYCVANQGNSSFYYVTFDKSLTADCWIRIPIKDVKAVVALPRKNTTEKYTPGLIYYLTPNNVYIGLDENECSGMSVLMIK